MPQSPILTQNVPSCPNRVCFLIPTHPARFERAKFFLDSFYRHGYEKQADVCFIFSNETDFEKWDEFTPFVILPIDVQKSIIGNNVVNVKKFYGLKKMAESGKYSYL